MRRWCRHTSSSTTFAQCISRSRPRSFAFPLLGSHERTTTVALGRHLASFLRGRVSVSLWSSTLNTSCTARHSQSLLVVCSRLRVPVASCLSGPGMGSARSCREMTSTGQWWARRRSRPQPFPPAVPHGRLLTSPFRIRIQAESDIKTAANSCSSVQIMGRVTSMSLRADSEEIGIGSDAGTLYSLRCDDMSVRTLQVWFAVSCSLLSFCDGTLI